MFGRAKKPSQILIDYIEGRGRGTEIDDYVHGNITDDEEEKIIRPLMRISKDYSTSEYPIGISNPDSFPSLRALADKLKSSNM